MSLATVTLGDTAGGKSRTLAFDLTSKGSTYLNSRTDERLLRAWG